MQHINIGVLIVAVLAAMGLIIYLVIRNRKDRKNFSPPDAGGDPVEEERAEQQRKRDSI